MSNFDESKVNRERDGKFGFKSAGAPQISLDCQPMLHTGSNTPFGKVQHVETLAPGIEQFFTASHGGIKLSAERNAAMPSCLRQKGGIYEEDCEWNKVAFVYGNEMGSKDYSSDEVCQIAEKGMKNYYPDKYEQLTGKTIPPGESYEKDRRLFKENNFAKGHFSPELGRPQPYLHDDQGRAFITAYSENGHRHKLTFDPDKAELNDKGNVVSIPPESVIEDLDYTADREEKAKQIQPYEPVKLVRQPQTPAGHRRLKKELNKRIRTEGGEIITFEEGIESGMFAGVQHYTDNGKNHYLLKLPADGNNHYDCYEINAELFKCLGGEKGK
ncbi:DUF7007 domain-containing protein [Actinomyces vulturis]|uniref:DUF7007 domain-containing protein n=1 Tax=Actinomyces vulturis TaxID=1857645 RepID=UPI00082CE4F8|nr:hypothetical protein [Actinomyces vulturis]